MTHQTQLADPLAKFHGMVPRYVRERRAAAHEHALMLASAPPPPPPPAAPDIHELLRDMRAVDAVTPDLRRRLAATRTPHVAFRLPTSGAKFAGAAIGVALLLATAVGVIS